MISHENFTDLYNTVIDISKKVTHGVLDKIEQAVLIVSNEGDILFANTYFLDLFHLSFKDACSMKVYDDRLGVSTRERFEAESGKTDRMGGKMTYERCLQINGRTLYCEITIVEFEFLGHMQFLYLAKDITEMRLTQIKADELNKMLNKIIDNLPVYLFVKDVDDDFRYLIWNKAFADSSQIPAEKVIGKTDFEVFPEYLDAQSFRDDDIKVVENGEMTVKTESYMAANGRTRIVQTYKTLIRRQNKGPLLVGISLDVTDIQGIEEELVQERLRAEESDRLKTRFLANMSHEIRTPLNAIVGFAGLLDDAEDAETRRNFQRIIEENSELLLQLINDILDLSKIEAGILEYTRMPMDLHAMLKNLHLTYNAKMPDDVKLVFDNEGSHEKFPITEDRNRLQQVVDNLLNNAIKFTSHGEIHYGYRVNGDHIEVYVSDTGIGIPADKIDTIFERFVKLDNFVHGTGLGLPICQLIVKTLGGRIFVESEEGKGSTFTFTIPYINDRDHEPELIDEEVAGATEAPRAIAPSEAKSELKILIAEDVSSNFLIVNEMIKGRYNVIWAKNGEEAVKLAREEVPDLIFMDIKMPGMDGLEATREIRKFDKKVPIVALTANAFDVDRSITLQAGMNNFLPKPINRDAFEAVLSAYLMTPLELFP